MNNFLGVYVVKPEITVQTDTGQVRTAPVASKLPHAACSAFECCHHSIATSHPEINQKNVACSASHHYLAEIDYDSDYKYIIIITGQLQYIVSYMPRVF